MDVKVDTSWQETWTESAKGIATDDGKRHRMDFTMAGNSPHEARTFLRGTLDVSEMYSDRDENNSTYYRGSFRASSEYGYTSETNLIVGEWIVVTWDGIRYGCKLEREEEYYAYAGGLDKYPFMFMFSCEGDIITPNNYFDVFCTALAAHTVVIESLGMMSTHEALRDYDVTLVCTSTDGTSSTTTSYANDEFKVQSNEVRSFQRGDRFLVTYDGVEYILDADIDNSEHAVMLGDESFRYYPFFLKQSGRVWTMAFEDGGTHSVKIAYYASKHEAVLHTKLFTDGEGNDYSVYDILSALCSGVVWKEGAMQLAENIYPGVTS